QRVWRPRCGQPGGGTRDARSGSEPDAAVESRTYRQGCRQHQAWRRKCDDELDPRFSPELGETGRSGQGCGRGGVHEAPASGAGGDGGTMDDERGDGDADGSDGGDAVHGDGERGGRELVPGQHRDGHGGDHLDGHERDDAGKRGAGGGDEDVQRDAEDGGESDEIGRASRREREESEHEAVDRRESGGVREAAALGTGGDGGAADVEQRGWEDAEPERSAGGGDGVHGDGERGGCSLERRELDRHRGAHLDGRGRDAGERGAGLRDEDVQRDAEDGGESDPHGERYYHSSQEPELERDPGDRGLVYEAAAPGAGGDGGGGGDEWEDGNPEQPAGRHGVHGDGERGGYGLERGELHAHRGDHLERR